MPSKERKPEETMHMKIFRDGKFRDMRVTLQERSRTFGAEAKVPGSFTS
jgi:hypothetical protein